MIVSPNYSISDARSKAEDIPCVFNMAIELSKIVELLKIYTASAGIRRHNVIGMLYNISRDI